MILLDIIKEEPSKTFKILFWASSIGVTTIVMVGMFYIFKNFQTNINKYDEEKKREKKNREIESK